MSYKDIVFDKGTKFLVTGGAGFIGSNISEALVEGGYAVRILDDFSTGKRENIENIKTKAEIIEGSICDYATCEKAVKGADYVIHQAAWGAIPRSIKMPLEYDSINVHGTLNMLQASAKEEVKKFVYASSSSVYGDEKTLPKKEGREGRLLAPYPITKAVNELYARNYTDLYHLDTVGLRYFNVYGRRQDSKSTYAAVIPIFIKKLMNGEAPTINGDGNYSRDFTYIDDVIQANLKACQSGEEAAGEAFNIAFGQRNTIGEMYSILSDLLDVHIEPAYGSTRAGDIPHSLADISKARELLGYNPKYSLKDGLTVAVDWYKENL
ncbi:MAG: SDR family oxidoreductase [Eubacteriales bacterium]